MTVDELTRQFMAKFQSYRTDKQFYRMPKISREMVYNTIANTLERLVEDKEPKSLWPGLVSEEVSRVTGIEYLDVYQTLMKAGAKKWLV